MYDGIGLQTARGIGTNNYGNMVGHRFPISYHGYSQRNLWFVKQIKEPIEYKSEDDIKPLENELNKVPKKEILEHHNKPQIEVKCSEMEDQLEEQSTNYKRSVNLVTLSAEQELKRYESQRLCETVSLITIIFGLLLVTITPFLLIPIWVIPNQYSSIIRNILWLSMLMTIVMLTLAALTGNIYWYYDEKSRKWKWFYHCGKGPENHYWGTSLFAKTKLLKRLAKSGQSNNRPINV